MTMYRSTRDNTITATASQAILAGLAPDGGLFVPDQIPSLPIPLESLASLSYSQVAYEVMKEFLSDYTKEELEYCIQGAYDTKFDIPQMVRLKEADGAEYLELFHGCTIAFKDMALSILPYLMTTAAKKNHMEKEIVILTATSGDTGKAALAGFADVPGTRIIVFYPKDGVSKVQEKQMVTQKGDNTFVVGIQGNFDDAQSGVKAMFGNEDLKERMGAAGFQFSSANSINIGRLVPQIVYYVYSYGQLLKQGKLKPGETMNVVVPTGNFGNILAADYAKEMGLPIEKLICASNINKVLFDFFQTGIYDRNREFILTSSPSMDILISSNLERLLYKISGGNDQETKRRMKELSSTGKYQITQDMKQALSEFEAGYASEEETAEEIKRLYEKTGYIIDTHTAVASAVYQQYRKKTGEERPTVIASTASPFKFARSVMSAIDGKYREQEDFQLIDALSNLSQVKIPGAIEEIRSAPVRHTTRCKSQEMQATVETFLKLQ